jgi:hypothetical protein
MPSSARTAGHTSGAANKVASVRRNTMLDFMVGILALQDVKPH